MWRELFTLIIAEKNMEKFTEDDLKKELETKEYEYGFYTDIESETFPVGLNEDIVRAISKKKGRARMDDAMAIRSVPSLGRND